LALFLFGGVAYLILELVWRGRTHWSMGVAGGAAFVLLYAVFTRMGEGALLLKCLIGALLITSLEFISGAIVNVGLKLNVWDYSQKRYQLYGQVCLTYSLLWGALCLPVALLVQAIHAVWG
jgi:uncharacterized membrane protein